MVMHNISFWILSFAVIICFKISKSVSANQSLPETSISLENEVTEKPPTWHEWASSSAVTASQAIKINVNKADEIPYFDRVKFGRESNLTEFFRKYVVNPSPGGAGGRARGRGRTGHPKPFNITHPANSGRTFKVPKGSVCVPNKKSVPVPVIVSPKHMIMPKCVVVGRCGGCCNDETHICEPAKSENVTREITLLKYVGSSKFEIEDQKNFTFRQDTECACNCRIKQEDCHSPLHIYKPRHCTCLCQNFDEHVKCLDEAEIRYWDNDSCTCRCRVESKHCSSGYEYDHVDTCDCVAVVEDNLQGNQTELSENDLFSDQDTYPV